LGEVYRVLKKDGLFVFSVPLRAFNFDITNKYGKAKSEIIDNRLKHMNYHSKSEWLTKLKDYSFKEIKTQTYFSENVLKIWYRLFKIYTFKIDNSEVWSLIKDYLGNKFYVKNLHIRLLDWQIARAIMKNENIGRKMMIFISARK
jgi:SAM-dependent methyltransferase